MTPAHEPDYDRWIELAIEQIEQEEDERELAAREKREFEREMARLERLGYFNDGDCPF